MSLKPTKQVLAALTDFYSNGVGEYAGKAFYFEKKTLRSFFDLICNGIQMV
jgi:hypothetical protein